MNFISTFAGIGGFDLALERADMKCVAQVEIDPRCLEVLEHHWPKVKRFTDVRTFGRKSIRGAVDLVCGGFPCQDLSVAGKRAGLAGERSGLFYDFARIVDEFSPEWVVGENVPGLLSSNSGLDFAIVLAGFTGIVAQVPDGGWRNAGLAWGPRYKVAWRVLDAQYFGVAQRRRRVFIVGCLTDGRAAQVLFESEGMFGDPPTRRAQRQSASTDVAPSLRGSGVGSHRIGEQTGQDPVIAVANPLGTHHGRNDLDNDTYAFDWQSGGDVRHGISDKPNLQASQVPAVFNQLPSFEEWIKKTKDLGGTRQEYDKLSDRLVTFGGNNTSGPIDIATARNVKGDTRLDFDTETFVTYGIYDEQTPKVGEDVMPTLRGRESAGGFQQSVAFTERTRKDGRNLELQEELSYALTNPGAGGRAHSRSIAGGFGVRRLTPTECARLQGFPDDWNNWLADSVRYRQFGNAVAIPVVEWIGRRIAAVCNT